MNSSLIIGIACIAEQPRQRKLRLLQATTPPMGNFCVPTAGASSRRFDFEHDLCPKSLQLFGIML
jgi:hypothetical protein